MTFEEFWNNRHTFEKVIRCTRSEAEFIWNAAKEDSKPVAKIVERKLYGMNKVEYSIIGFDGFEVAIRDTIEQAEKWVIENGYRLK